MIRERIQESVDNLLKLLRDEHTIAQISKSAAMIVAALKNGNKLLICGNGGSAADAQHIAGEFLCRFYRDRDPMPAIALSTDTSVITSIANDYAYDEVFSRQVRGLGKPGDVLIGISTSGSSRNVMLAFQAARQLGVKSILLTGAVQKEIAKIGDLVISTPSTDTPRIQEMHLIIEHLICEIVEKEINPEGVVLRS